jgi:ribosome-associated protein
MDAGQKADDKTELAREIGALINSHKGGNVVVLNLCALNLWTDFFVISTVTSSAHMAGIAGHIQDFLRSKDIDILHANLNRARDEDWELIDTGGIVIHLMTERARGFYELEHLWGDAEQIRIT